MRATARRTSEDDPPGERQGEGDADANDTHGNTSYKCDPIKTLVPSLPINKEATKRFIGKLANRIDTLADGEASSACIASDAPNLREKKASAQTCVLTHADGGDDKYTVDTAVELELWLVCVLKLVRKECRLEVCG